MEQPLPLKEVPAEGACLGPTSKQEGSSVPAIYLCLFPLNLTKVFAFDSGFECRKKRYPLFLKARLSLIHSFPCQFTLASLIGESPLYEAQASVVINITYKRARTKCTQTSASSVFDLSIFQDHGHTNYQFPRIGFCFWFLHLPSNQFHAHLNVRISDQDVPVVPNNRSQGLDWLPTRSPHLLQSLSISGFLVENLEIDLNRWQFWLAGCAECRPGEPETASNCRGSRQLLLIYLIIIISRIRMVIRIILIITITIVLVEWCWWCEWSHLSAVALFSKRMDLEGQERTTNQQKLVFVIKIDHKCRW